MASPGRIKAIIALLVAFELAYVFMVVMLALVSRQWTVLAALSALSANAALFAKEHPKPIAI